MNRNPASSSSPESCLSPAVSADELRYAYSDTGHSAVDGVSFSVAPGETLVVAGPNGAGKTTLLMMAAGLIEGGGYAGIFGVRASPSSLPRYRRRLGFLFQNPDEQLFMPTVFDDVAFSLVADKLPPEDVGRRVSDALARAGFTASAATSPHNLSFGEKKRAALAAALVTNPDILILDEPTLGLDPPSKRDFIALLGGIKASKLISTHDLELAGRLADKILFIERGKSVFYGPSGEFFAGPLSYDFFGDTRP